MWLAVLVGCGHAPPTPRPSPLTVQTEATKLGENGQARCAIGPNERGLLALDVRVDSECPSDGPLALSIDFETRDLRPHLTRSYPGKLSVLPAHNDYSFDGMVYPNNGSLVTTTVSARCTNRDDELVAVAYCRYHAP